MPHPTESTDQDRTLPLPELNPLINPLLGQHMGRWAEVYFTAAPEHREEAVLALLRELERGESKPAELANKTNPVRIQFADESAPGPEQFSPRDSGRAALKLDRTEPNERRFLVCGSCGHSIRERQKFCGMCGAPVRGETAGFDVEQGHYNYEAEESYPNQGEDFQETAFSFGGNLTATDESVPYRYRIYVGTALILLIAALVLMAYRGTRDWSGRSHSLSQAAPSTESQPPAQPSAKSEVLAPATDNHSTAATADGKVEPKRDSQPSTAPPPASAAASQNLAAPLTPQSQVPNPQSSAASPGNGSEELQVAERFLTGAHGSARDSREAAKWLWQAVGKQNAAATVLLSDLYLRGDGVPKNCDQARLLLDAAARKGAAGAGGRLRNLQAFGCP